MAAPFAAPARGASKPAPVAVMLFGAAFLRAAAQFPNSRMGPGWESIAIALNLVHQGSFANPYAGAVTGATAHCPPLYPAFLAIFFALFGVSGTAVVAISVCYAAAHGLHAAILPSVSKLVFRDRTPGVCGAVLGILLPLFPFDPPWESMWVATGAMAFCLLSNRLAEGGGGWRGAAAGGAAGVLALLNPAATAPAFLWLAFLAWRGAFHLRTRFALGVAAGFVIMIAPWTWRNYRELHSWFFIRDNAGLELYVSNHDGADVSMARNIRNGSFDRMHPSLSQTEAEAVARMGEVAYNRDRGLIAIRWMRTHPVRYLVLTAERVQAFWFWGPMGRAWPVTLVTVLAAVGITTLARRRAQTVCFLVAALALYPIPYYLVQFDPRYRTPILWVSLLAAGYAVAPVWEACRRRFGDAFARVKHGRPLGQRV